MIPASADAVVQIEHTQMVSSEQSPISNLQSPNFPFEIEVLKSVAVGQNVLQVGEDVQVGAEILPAGHILRPQDVGGLLALGITAVSVRLRPRVGILATGDEVIAPQASAGPGQIRDINSYTVAGLVEQAGGVPILGGIIPDDFAALETAAANMLAETDMLVMSRRFHPFRRARYDCAGD